MICEAVSDDDLHALVRVLINKGKGGDLMAIREILDRLIGKPTATVISDNNVNLESLAVGTDGRDMRESAIVARVRAAIDAAAQVDAVRAEVRLIQESTALALDGSGET